MIALILIKAAGGKIVIPQKIAMSVLGTEKIVTYRDLATGNIIMEVEP